MWPEIAAASNDKRKELLLDGAAMSKQVDETGGLDSSLFELTDLNFLRISQTSLTHVDPKISQLSEKLTSLVLHRNSLSDLPSSLGELVHLKLLDVAENKLTTLEPSVCSLPSLLTLNLGQNELQQLPDMSGLTNLHELLVTGNKLKDLPEGLHSLAHLATIEADHNLISSLPDTIASCHMLKVLNLADNQLTDLPPALVLLEKLKLLDLRRNKFSDRKLLKLANVEQTQPKGVFKFLKPLHDKQKSSGSKKKGAAAKCVDEEVDDITESIKVLHCADPKASGVQITIEETVASVRPFIVCCIIRNLDLTKTSTAYKQFIAIQTRLHEGICEKRLTATIATHDLQLIKAPLVYRGDDPAQTELVPLGRQKALSAAEFMKKLQKEADDQRKAKKRSAPTGIHKYLDLLKGKTSYPFLVDRNEAVISFPPITNCESTKISAETRDVLVEVTSSKSLQICKQVMENLIKELLAMAIGSSLEGDGEGDRRGNHLVVEQVRVVDTSAQLKTVYPSRIDLVDVPCTVLRDN